MLCEASRRADAGRPALREPVTGAVLGVFMSGVQIVADSACDLPDDILRSLGVEVAPLSICFGEEVVMDHRDLSAQDFWLRCKSTRTLPTTAAPAPGAFLDIFERARDAGKDGVVCVTMSEGISGTYQSAVKASEMLVGDLPVAVLDSRTITIAEGLVVLTAAELAADGGTLAEVRAATEDATLRARGFVALDTLENLRKGGRIGAAQSLFGSALSVKPIIKMEDGIVVAESRQRTRGRALDYLIETMKRQGEVDLLGITHGDAADVMDFLELVSNEFPGVRVIWGQMGAVLGAHVGIGAVCLAGLCRQGKDPDG